MNKERVKKYGEVFTPIWVVNEMLDNVGKENKDAFNPEHTFLEPTCGTGNFVIEIYRRKLNKCRTKKDAELGILEKVSYDGYEVKYMSKDGYWYYHCHKLTQSEVAELTGYKVEEAE